jgi:hypothetical protein
VPAGTVVPWPGTVPQRERVVAPVSGTSRALAPARLLAARGHVPGTMGLRILTRFPHNPDSARHGAPRSTF